jgi:hypothetical protein
MNEDIYGDGGHDPDDESSAARRKRTKRFLTDEILPQAAKRHLEVLRDPKVTGQTLNRAIELAFKYGFGDAEAARTKELHEMTADELAEAIALLERTAAGRARLVEANPRRIDKADPQIVNKQGVFD